MKQVILRVRLTRYSGCSVQRIIAWYAQQSQIAAIVVCTGSIATMNNPVFIIVVGSARHIACSNVDMGKNQYLIRHGLKRKQQCLNRNTCDCKGEVYEQRWKKKWSVRVYGFWCLCSRITMCSVQKLYREEMQNIRRKVRKICSGSNKRKMSVSKDRLRYGGTPYLFFMEVNNSPLFSI